MFCNILDTGQNSLNMLIYLLCCAFYSFCELFKNKIQPIQHNATFFNKNYYTIKFQ